VRSLLLLAPCVLSLTLAAETPVASPIFGRWTVDVPSATKAMHQTPQYASGNLQIRDEIDRKLATMLPMLAMEIRDGELRGMNGTQHFEVKSATGKRIVLHVSEPAPGGDLLIDVFDANTIRVSDGESDEFPLILHRDLEYAARMAQAPLTAAERERWFESMRGVWNVDIGTPIVEAMRASEAYRRSSRGEKRQAEAMARRAFGDAEPDLVEFTTDSMRGVPAPGKTVVSRQPAAIELTVIDGTKAYAIVTEANDVRGEWMFERRADGTVRVSNHGRAMFDLKRVRD
jgi:hypothetical protein